MSTVYATRSTEGFYYVLINNHLILTEDKFSVEKSITREF